MQVKSASTAPASDPTLDTTSVKSSDSHGDDDDDDDEKDEVQIKHQGHICQDMQQCYF